MTKPVNAIDKPSSTDKPVDKGGKSKVRKEDKKYNADEPHSGEIAKKHERDEQPVESVKKAPTKGI
ncbi:hypothetical protein [Mucilaginibacter xinganensis]|uniref:Uncharacterized protein n=1 Tax=Mucilaginibacter xinganensis TaxID=1234841 RepID=A0A223NT60_9SPHI|nr:hypothetical protein [Mucilaginibacter xinganensis]ASU32864.1 hypothetical protein MuYL_0964 [Mucilaginibacter xinganensis]